MGRLLVMQKIAILQTNKANYGCFPKDYFGIVNKGESLFEFSLKLFQQAWYSYLIPSEVISTAQFRPPKFNTTTKFGKE